MPAGSVKVLLHASGVSVSTTAKRIQSTVAPVPGCAWSAELRRPTQAELVPIYALEAASYPADEAASEEGMKFRLANAATFFRAFYCIEAPHAPASAVQHPTLVEQPQHKSVYQHLTRVPVRVSQFPGRARYRTGSAARVYQWNSGVGRGTTPRIVTSWPAVDCRVTLG